MESAISSFWTRERVAQEFAVTTSTLLRWESRGLVKAIRSGDHEGYGKLEVRRVWTILTFQRDLGINLAGIEVILRLRDQMQATHTQLERLVQTLLATLDEATPADESDA